MKFGNSFTRNTTPTLHMKISLPKLCAVLAFSMIASSHGQVLLNFQLNGGVYSTPNGDQSYSGAAAIGQVGDVWNHLTLYDRSALTPTTGFVYSDGSAATGVSITNLSNWDLSGAIIPSVTGNGLLNSYMGASPAIAETTPSTLTISGLTPGGSYNLYVIASSDHQGVGGIFSVNGSATQTLNGAPGANFTLGVDTLLFNVIADINGSINISETATSVQYRVLNGIQLEAVPEPSTWALLGLGAAVVIGRVSLRNRHARNQISA